MPPYNCNCDPKFLNDFSPDIEVLPKNCPAVWDLVCEGNTKGCFQLESNLGKSLAKECLPRNIDELAALVSIMRPGCLEAMREGKSITKHYIDRKNGKEEVTYYHSALENILSDTYGEMIYQEGALRIARDIAGFSLQEADTLRKAVGKKLADVMAKVKKQFIKGCKKQGIVNEKEAKDIFSWIEKSQRYNFNKSHGVSYAENGYLSAYIKTHYPYEFFTGWLTFAYGKPKPREELYELIQNARAMEIEVLGPDLRKLNDGFELIDNKIYFGLSSIKNVGVAVLKKIHYVIEEIGTPVQEWKWIDFVLSFRPKITSTAVQSLIESGAVQYLGNNRTRMCYECKVCAQLTKKELDWIRLRKKETLEECLVELLASPTGKGGGIANKRRWPAVQDLLHSLQSPPYQLEDTATWLAGVEQNLLGVALTCSTVDACDISAANSTCHDFRSQNGGYYLIPVQIDTTREITIKNGQSRGKKMAFLGVSDSTGALDSVTVFNQEWKQYRGTLEMGNTVMLAGKKDKKRGCLIVEKVFQIS